MRTKANVSNLALLLQVKDIRHESVLRVTQHIVHLSPVGNAVERKEIDVSQFLNVGPRRRPLLLEVGPLLVRHALGLEHKVLALDRAVLHELRQRVHELQLGRAVETGRLEVVNPSLRHDTIMSRRLFCDADFNTLDFDALKTGTTSGIHVDWTRIPPQVTMGIWSSVRPNRTLGI